MSIFEFFKRHKQPNQANQASQTDIKQYLEINNNKLYEKNSYYLHSFEMLKKLRDPLGNISNLFSAYVGHINKDYSFRGNEYIVFEVPCGKK